MIKIEKNVGFALLMANCVRVSFQSHTLVAVAVTCDVLALFGGILFFRGLLLQRRQS
jgi:hypothetical protein